MPATLKIDLPTFFDVGEHKVENLFKILQFHKLDFAKILLLGDRKTLKLGGDAVASKFRREGISVNKRLITNSDEKNVNRIKKAVTENQPDLVIGFGGGKVLDVGKLAAGENNTKFISIPTTLSNDGISSPVAVIKDEHNIPVSHITKAPYGVVVDIQVIKRAPMRHVKAGVGDVISNLSAVFDARLAQLKGIEEVNDTALSLAETGPINLLNFKGTSIKTNEFLLLLAQGLIKSGFAMCIVGSSRPASGSEHKISHSIDHLYSPRKNLHGEQVGIAALFTMALQKNQYLDKVKKLYTQIAFPQKIKKLYLNTDQFIRVVLNATKIRAERYTILDEVNLTPKEIKKIIREAKL
jgi:glycerol-1-phosphate dehydrogenase [NAD(P)+]